MSIARHVINEVGCNLLYFIKTHSPSVFFSNMASLTKLVSKFLQSYQKKNPAMVMITQSYTSENLYYIFYNTINFKKNLYAKCGDVTRSNPDLANGHLSHVSRLKISVIMKRNRALSSGLLAFTFGWAGDHLLKAMWPVIASNEVPYPPNDVDRIARHVRGGEERDKIRTNANRDTEQTVIERIIMLAVTYFFPTPCYWKKTRCSYWRKKNSLENYIISEIIRCNTA